MYSNYLLNNDPNLFFVLIRESIVRMRTLHIWIDTRRNCDQYGQDAN